MQKKVGSKKIIAYMDVMMGKIRQPRRTEVNINFLPSDTL